MEPLFSIVMVSLNPGDKIFETLQSVQAQSCKNYQIVIKDGGSKDGTKEKLQEYLYQNPDMANRICLVETPDKSIYDGMNQALEYVEGDFVYFLNCGDSFYDGEVLAQLEPVLVADLENGEALRAGIYYGDQFDMLQQTVVASNP
ncbi:MAG: glycosyltransferase, partial [Lachnospiraceae bacterium]|nr:glycosyltransferase [Lachnospiraceae bacterium]